FASSSTSCTGASQGGACDDDANDHCSGSNATTCVDAFKSSATVCRTAVNGCDEPESCTGSSGACPDDGFKSAATLCDFGSSTGGLCDTDAADHCAGTSATCVDAYQASGYVCRGAVNACDEAETCSGSSGACPADGFKSAATLCTFGSSTGGACDDDAADHC